MHNRTPVGLRSAVAALGAAALGVALLIAPASAKPTVSAGAAGSGHCVIHLSKGAAKPTSTACFSTFTEAIADATGGAVTDAPAVPSAATKDALAEKINAANIAALSAQSAQPLSLPLSIEYEGVNYGGAWSLTVTGDSGACTFSTGDIDYSLSLPEYIDGIRVWDAISSFETFFSSTQCFTDHYYLQNFGLPRTGFVADDHPVDERRRGPVQRGQQHPVAHLELISQPVARGVLGTSAPRACPADARPTRDRPLARRPPGGRRVRRSVPAGRQRSTEIRLPWMAG